jgi:hypothetical protein
MFVLLTIVANTIDTATAFGTDDMTILEKLMSFGNINFVDPRGSSNFFVVMIQDAGAILGAAGNFLDAVWSMLWFNYNFLNNGGFLGMVVKMALFWPISIGMLFGLFITLRQAFQG